MVQYLMVQKVPQGIHQARDKTAIKVLREAMTFQEVHITCIMFDTFDMFSDASLSTFYQPL